MISVKNSSYYSFILAIDGHDDVMRMASELQGCPVSGPFSRAAKAG